MASLRNAWRLRHPSWSGWLLGLLLVLLAGPRVALADSVFIDPPVARPDSDGIVRFSVSVEGVPEPGFRSYALTLDFQGTDLVLVDAIDTGTTPVSETAITCAASLRLDGPRETVVPGSLVILESGQGGLVLGSRGEGVVLAADNRITDGHSAVWNVGVAGLTDVVTPQVGSGSLIELRCLVGSAVPAGSTVTVVPGLYPALDGAVLLDEAGSAPVIDTFVSGVIESAAGNHPPVAADDVATTLEDVSVTIDVLANDEDPDPETTLTIVEVTSPANGSVTSDGTTVTYTPNPNYSDASVPDSFQYRISDGVDVSELALVTVTVTPVNDAPELQPIGDQSVNEGELLSVAIAATDTEGGILTFEATGLPMGASLTDNGAGTALLAWTPDFDQAGSYPVRITVLDDGTPVESDWEDITITVHDVNRAPVFDLIPAQSVSEGELLSFTVHATDPDGDAITLSAPQLPPGAVFVDNGGGSGLFSWTSDFNQAGGHEAVFLAVDDGSPTESGSLTVSIAVADVNRPPVLNLIGNKTVTEGVALSFVVTATDPDGDHLTLRAEPLPAGASFVDNGSGTGSFSWTPALDQAGDYNVIFTAADDGSPVKSTTEGITISVIESNLPPTFSPVADQVVSEGAVLSLLLTASDPNGDAVAVTVADLPMGAEIIDHGDGTASFSWTPAYDQAGDYTVIFTATDAGDPVLTTSVIVAIRVLEGNQAPVLDPIGDKTVDAEQLLSFAVTASDPDGDTVTLAAGNLPTDAVFIDNFDGTGDFSWIPSIAQIGNHSVLFTVTDDGTPAKSDFEEITITVGEVNRTPVLDPIGNRSVPEGELLEITLTASDPDGDALSFTADNLPAGAMFFENTDGTGLFEWTPGFDQAGNYDVIFTVTDDGVPAESDSETVTISVGDVNRPPVLDPIGNRNVNEGELLEILLTSSDPDGDGLAMTVDGLPTGAVFTDNEDGTALFEWMPAFDQSGNYDLTFTVTDDGVPSESDAESITISVGDVNRPPVLDPVGDRTVNERDLLTITLSASDPDGDNLYFSADGLPDTASLIDHGDATAEFSWLADIADFSELLITFKVTDDGEPQESDAEAVTITVVPAGEAPEAPEKLKAKLRERVVYLTWRASASADNYVVYRRLDTEKVFNVIGEARAISYQDSLPTEAKAAEYYVTAENEFGESDPSNIVKVTMKQTGGGGR